MSAPATTSAPQSRLSTVVQPLVPVIVLLGVMWATEIVDLAPAVDLDQYGIRPREIGGLDGVAFAPFLHAGFQHLIANSVPFAVLGAVIALGSVRNFARVTLIVGLIAGLGTWLTGGSNTIHLGASGIVFGYLVYLMTRGIFDRRPSYLIGGVIVAFVYGSILWGVLPTPGISWQGHLFGAIGGVCAASTIHERKPAKAGAPDRSVGRGQPQPRS